MTLQVNLFSTRRRRLLIEFTVSTSRNKTVNGITYVDPWYGYTVKPAVQVRVCIDIARKIIHVVYCAGYISSACAT